MIHLMMQQAVAKKPFNDDPVEGGWFFTTSLSQPHSAQCRNLFAVLPNRTFWQYFALSDVIASLPELEAVLILLLNEFTFSPHFGVSCSLLAITRRPAKLHKLILHNQDKQTNAPDQDNLNKT